MITYKGRVVYERIEHKMTEKDAARIMASLSQDLNAVQLAKKLWGIDMKIVELKVLSDDDILQFIFTILKLAIDYVDTGLDWLWDFLVGVLLGQAPPQPDVSEETKDA